MQLNQIALAAETAGIYCVQSELRGLLYCYADGEYALVRPNGLVRIKASELNIIIKELQGIREDIAYLEKMGIER